jgi:hypothetical protein
MLDEALFIRILKKAITMSKFSKLTAASDSIAIKNNRPPSFALFSLAVVIVLPFIPLDLHPGNWGFGIVVGFLQAPLFVAFILSMMPRTRAVGLSMASTSSIIGAILGTPILIIAIGTPEEEFFATILSIAVWVAAIATVTGYCKLPKNIKNSSMLYLGIFLPFGIWLLIMGIGSLFP